MPEFTVFQDVAEAAEWAVPGTRRLSYCSSFDGTIDWALVLPGTGSVWIVCIHGHGSNGAQLYTRPDLRRTWLPAFRERGYGILTPNLRGNAWMAPTAATDLRCLLNHVRVRFGAEHFIFSSGSMGGTSNLIYAALHPHDVAGVIARCPASDLASYHEWCRVHQPQNATLKQIADAIENAYGGPPVTKSDVYQEHSALVNAERLTMPLFIAHGTADALIPVHQSRRLIGRLAEVPRCCYVEIPDGDHDSPLTLNEDPNPLDWIAAHVTVATNTAPHRAPRS